MEIRKDFEPVAVFMHRLLEYQKAFSKNDAQRWPDLEDPKDYEAIFSLPHNLRVPMVLLSEVGREYAIFMIDRLGSFNDANRYPTLSSYVDSLEDCLADEEVELNKCYNEAHKAYHSLGYRLHFFEETLVLFKQQLKLLEATKRTFNHIKQTSLYKLEKGINDIPTEQITPETAITSPIDEIAQTGYLTFDGKNLKLQKQQVKLLKALKQPTKIKKILNDVFDCKYADGDKIKQSDRNRFDVAKNRLNSCVKKELKIKDDIIINSGDSTYRINEKFLEKINLTRQDFALICQ